MYNFCTLFDTNYLSRGLALHKSLENVCDSFHLYIFAFDDAVYEILNKMNLANTTVISLNQFEDDELLSVKHDRTIGEYCWTATPKTIHYVIKNFNVELCTYVDADVYFYCSPKAIFDELGNKSILITEHRFSPEYKGEEKKSGKYCVQFISFRNDEFGTEALNWWKNQCIIWCYSRLEDGKFGDQMYLDDWTTRFNKVHVLQHLGAGLAGWNISQYDFFQDKEKFYGVEKTTGKMFDVIFFHFHYLKFYSNGKLDLGPRIISNKVKQYFYQPYLKELQRIKKEVLALNSNIDPHGTEKQTYNWRTPLRYLRRKIFGLHNVERLDKYLKE